MYFYHSDDVWRSFPELSALVFTLRGVRRLATGDVSASIDQILAGVAARQAETPDADRPAIRAWRQAYATMGLKPTQYRCAAEALLRRYRKEGSMPSFHPLINLLNARSMEAALPIAAFDLDRVAGGISVRPAEGTESFETFQGETEHPAAGEIVFADEANVAHSRRWVFRQGATSIVSPASDKVLVVIEGLHDSVRSDLAALRDVLLTELHALEIEARDPVILTPGDRYEFDMIQ